MKAINGNIAKMMRRRFGCYAKSDNSDIEEAVTKCNQLQLKMCEALDFISDAYRKWDNCEDRRFASQVLEECSRVAKAALLEGENK